MSEIASHETLGTSIAFFIAFNKSLAGGPQASTGRHISATYNGVSKSIGNLQMLFAFSVKKLLAERIYSIHLS